MIRKRFRRLELCDWAGVIRLADAAVVSEPEDEIERTDDPQDGGME